MPMSLRKYFGLRRIRARDLGVSAVNGAEVSADQWVFPRIAVLPMGWSWALYCCQKIHEHIVERAGLLEAERLQDFTPPPSGSFFHIQYVDNLHVAGTSRDEVVGRFRLAVQALRDAGLTVHEVEECEETTKVLGWEYEGGNTFRPGRARVWKVRAALREILRRGVVSGQQLERLVGHITFISLGRREAMSVFGDVYTFMRRHYSSVAPLWKSVRKELSIWDGICPLILQDLTQPWSQKLLAVDASEWGLGVCESESSLELNRELGRYSERWRFKDPKASSARAFTFDEDENVRGLVSLQDERSDEGGEFSDSSSFGAVGFTVVNRAWHTVGRNQWKKKESMPVLECRATLHAVKHVLRSIGNHRQRHLILTDSMTAALAVSKGRAHTHILRNVVQGVSALSLATGTAFHLRWIPSEWNPADSPSRGGFEPSELQRVVRDAVPGSTDSGPVGPRHCIKKETEDECKRGPRLEGPARASERGHCERSEAAKAICPPNSFGHSHQTGWWESAAGGLCPTLDRFPQLVSRPPVAGGQGGGHGCLPRAVPRYAVRCGGGSCSGKLCQGERVVSPSGAEKEEQPQPGTTGPEGMACAQPSQEPHANTVRGCSTSGDESSERVQVGDRPLSVDELHVVPQARGVREDQSVRHSEASQERRASIQAVEHSPPSIRGGHPIKDCAVGRGSEHRPRVPAVSGPSFRQAPQVAGEAPARQSILCDNGAGECLHGDTVRRRGACSAEAASHVSAAPRRRVTRAGLQTAAHPGGPDPREMAVNQVSQELRKGVSSQPVVWGPQQTKAKEVHRSTRRSRCCLPQPALGRYRSLQQPVFLDIFSVSGRLGSSVAAQCGWFTLLWDITLGEDYDLTRFENQRKIFGWMQSGFFRAGHLGTPCNSMSRARDQPGGPPPLRSDQHPLGLPNLLPHDQRKVAIGNILMRFSAKVLNLALQVIIAFTLENPARSRLWICPPIAAVMRRRNTQFQLVEYCMFGKPWRKSTGFLGIHLNLDLLASFRCIGSKRGVCKHSGKSHLPLSGMTADGQWRTKIAEPYPHKLCRIPSQCFNNADTQRIANNFSRHW